MKHNNHLYLQDNYQLLSIEDISPDGFHPNIRGNEKLAEGWMSAINSSLARLQSAEN